MLGSDFSHSETLFLKANVEQVRRYIRTPERILEYYPAPIDCGAFEPGKSFYCRGKSGVSLMEVIEAETTPNRIVMKITSASGLKGPITIDAIRGAVFFTMKEDWDLEETGDGTKMVRRWYDVDQRKMKLIPIKLLIRISARQESPKLIKAWNKVALADR